VRALHIFFLSACHPSLHTSLYIDYCFTYAIYATALRLPYILVHILMLYACHRSLHTSLSHRTNSSYAAALLLYFRPLRKARSAVRMPYILVHILLLYTCHPSLHTSLAHRTYSTYAAALLRYSRPLREALLALLKRRSL
jgi:hypothetical protein